MIKAFRLAVFASLFVPFVLKAQNDQFSRFLAEEKYDVLLAYTDSLLVADSNDYNAYHARGMAFKSMQNYQAAISSFQKAWVDGHLLQSGIQLGQVLQESGQSDAAMATYNSILAVDSTNAKVRYALGKLQLAEGNTALAISHFTILFQSDTLNPLYAKSLADSYDQADNLFDAIHYYLVAVNLNPADRNSTFRLCNLFVKSNNVPAGLAYASNFLKTHPSDIKFLKLNGYMNLLILQPREAISYFNKAIMLGDSSFFTNKYIGIALHDISNYDTSICFLKEAKKVEPKDAEISFYIGKCYSMLSVPDSAIPYLLNTISLLSPSPSFLASIQMTIAENYNQKKRPLDALACIYEARRLNEDPEVYFMLARQYDFFNNKPDSAEYYYRRFVDLVSAKKTNSADPQMHEHLARAQERLNKFREDSFWEGRLDSASVK